MLNFTQAELLSMVNAVLVAGGEYQDFSIILFTNDVEPDENTVVGDLVEPTASWYAAVDFPVLNEPHWGAPYYIPGPGVEVAGLANAQWDFSGGDPEEVVYGYAILVDLGGTPRYVAGGRLETPKPMGALGDSVVLTPQLSWAILQMPDFVQVSAS